jgi:hypothetical protein
VTGHGERGQVYGGNGLSFLVRDKGVPVESGAFAMPAARQGRERSQKETAPGNQGFPILPGLVERSQLVG